MKKIFATLAILASVVLFSSCTDDFMEEIFDLVSGNATTTVTDNDSSDTDEYTSSIVMFNKKESNPYAIGLSMSIDINDLMNLKDADDIKFPFLCYRFTGNIRSNQTLKVNNILTNEDVEDFDYHWLLNGKFSTNHIVGIAVSDTKFYIMSKGNVSLNKVSKTKVTGSFSGSAYVLDLNATPKLSEEQVTISGTFKSRVTSMMSWLEKLQEEADESEEIAEEVE